MYMEFVSMVFRLSVIVPCIAIILLPACVDRSRFTRKKISSQTTSSLVPHKAPKADRVVIQGAAAVVVGSTIIAAGTAASAVPVLPALAFIGLAVGGIVLLKALVEGVIKDVQGEEDEYVVEEILT